MAADSRAARQVEALAVQRPGPAVVRAQAVGERAALVRACSGDRAVAVRRTEDRDALARDADAAALEQRHVVGAADAGEVAGHRSPVPAGAASMGVAGGSGSVSSSENCLG